MENCIFCKIVNGKMQGDIVFEDEAVVVFRDIRPKALVHLLIVCREHINNLKEVKEKHHALIAHMLAIQPMLAQKEGLANGFRTIINTGAAAGQEIDHLHFHLLGGGKLPGFA
jgi:histidine triad (HIT) family protein